MEWYYRPHEAYTDFFALDSWVEVASQPSSSSLSSVADEIVTTGLRVQHDPRHARRRRILRPGAPSTITLGARPASAAGTSSQDEYEESESESDRVMTSSGEGPQLQRAMDALRHRAASSAPASSASDDPPLVSAKEDDDDDENRTAVNYPINNDLCFTPQPNAFSHPPTGQPRGLAQPAPDSYFPTAARVPSRPSTRSSLPTPSTHHDSTRPSSHLPHNILSPSYSAAAHHDEALRASLSTLLSCAAAARGLKPDPKRPQPAVASATARPARTNRIEPMSIRLVPESALPVSASPTTLQLEEPTFHPTLRRASTSTASTTSSPDPGREAKRKPLRSSSKERRAVKKARRAPTAAVGSASGAASPDDVSFISPTLLTWVVSAGVVVVLSALTFSAGYSLGREAGRLEAGGGGGAGAGVAARGFSAGDEAVRNCAREAGRSGLGLKRSLARSAVQV